MQINNHAHREWLFIMGAIDAIGKIAGGFGNANSVRHLWTYLPIRPSFRCWFTDD